MITREDISSFHKEHYLPNKTIITVVGDISKTELNSLLERYFMNWRKKDSRELLLPALEFKDKPKS